MERGGASETVGISRQDVRRIERVALERLIVDLDLE
jgi:hypothetical protein